MFLLMFRTQSGLVGRSCAPRPPPAEQSLCCSFTLVHSLFSSPQGKKGGSTDSEPWNIVLTRIIYWQNKTSVLERESGTAGDLPRGQGNLTPWLQPSSGQAGQAGPSPSFPSTPRWAARPQGALGRSWASQAQARGPEPCKGARSSRLHSLALAKLALLRPQFQAEGRGSARLLHLPIPEAQRTKVRSSK